MGFSTFALAALTALLGLGIGLRFGRSMGYEEASKDQHGSEVKRRLYRDAAKIFNDLIHANDLSIKEVPILPESFQKRIGDWLDRHRKEIGINNKEGK